MTQSELHEENLADRGIQYEQQWVAKVDSRDLKESVALQQQPVPIIENFQLAAHQQATQQHRQRSQMVAPPSSLNYGPGAYGKTQQPPELFEQHPKCAFPKCPNLVEMNMSQNSWHIMCYDHCSPQVKQRTRAERALISSSSSVQRYDNSTGEWVTTNVPRQSASPPTQPLLRPQQAPLRPQQAPSRPQQQQEQWSTHAVPPTADISRPPFSSGVLSQSPLRKPT